jgi:hypothetical protein
LAGLFTSGDVDRHRGGVRWNSDKTKTPETEHRRRVETQQVNLPLSSLYELGRVETFRDKDLDFMRVGAVLSCASRRSATKDKEFDSRWRYHYSLDFTGVFLLRGNFAGEPAET